jgi:hypothetical protein
MFPSSLFWTKFTGSDDSLFLIIGVATLFFLQRLLKEKQTPILNATQLINTTQAIRSF